jgi:septum formation protein
VSCAPGGVPRLVLASGSPRRRQLLELIGLDFTVSSSGVEESPEPGESAPAFAERAARDKALAVAGRGGALPVLGADTVVEVDGALLGKPTSDREAATMLRALAGRAHRVHTGLALAAGGALASLVDSATVHFLAMTEVQIRWYVATGEPRDKAGAYAVQGLGGLFVRGVEGSPQTVVGLPLHRLAELWSMLGLSLWDTLSPRG